MPENLIDTLIELQPEILKATGETLLMLAISLSVAIVLGGALGILVFLSSRGQSLERFRVFNLVTNGVINVVHKEGYEGLTFQGRLGSPTEEGGDEEHPEDHEAGQEQQVGAVGGHQGRAPEVEAAAGDVAFAIPCPARRTTANWVLPAVPLEAAAPVPAAEAHLVRAP